MNIKVTGHIKVGETTKGLVGMTSNIKLTTTGKKGGENFQTFPGTESNGYNFINVKLPYIFHSPLLNFEIKKVSFVLVNEIYKYRAEAIGASIYLFPYQPNFEDPEVNLPVIKFGTIKKFGNGLDLQKRAIGTFFVEETQSFMDFKTSSAFSISEIKETLTSLATLKPEILANLNLKLVFKTKLFKTKKFEEVSYLTIAEPSVEDIIEASNKPVNELALKSLEALENYRFKQREELKKKAISGAAIEEFFGKKITVGLDSEANQDFTFIGKSSTDIISQTEEFENKKSEAQESLAQKEAAVEANQDILSSLIEKEVPEAIGKALIVKFGNEAYAKAESVKFEVSNLIKFISQQNS